MVGVEGFEPPVSGPEPDALPLGYTPIEFNDIIVCQEKIAGKLKI